MFVQGVNSQTVFTNVVQFIKADLCVLKACTYSGFLLIRVERILFPVVLFRKRLLHAVTALEKKGFSNRLAIRRLFLYQE